MLVIYLCHGSLMRLLASDQNIVIISFIFILFVKSNYKKILKAKIEHSGKNYKLFKYAKFSKTFLT